MSSNKLLKNDAIALHMYLSFHSVIVGGWKLNFFKLYRYQYYYPSKCFINNCWKKRLTDLRNQNIGTESLCCLSSLSQISVHLMYDLGLITHNQAFFSGNEFWNVCDFMPHGLNWVDEKVWKISQYRKREWI